MLTKIFNVINFIFNHPLTKKNKFKAIKRFFFWQVTARVLRKKVIIPWVESSSFILQKGETGLSGNLYVGFVEFEEMMFLLHALRKEETFVDIGANVGAYTILASKVVKTKSISFEPLAETIKRLNDQIQINQISDLVSVKNRGVSDKKGVLHFTNNNDTLNKVSLDINSKNLTKIDVTTIDEELDKDKKYFFKIDVEGFEYNVIKGGEKILSSQNVIALIIELNSRGNDYGYSNQDIHNKLVSLNFKPISYEPISRSIRILDNYNKSRNNTIYVKNIDLIKKRCKRAPYRSVHTVGNIYL